MFDPSENWKYIFNATTGKQELYDLRADATEQRNLASAAPRRAAEMHRRTAAWANFEARYMAAVDRAGSR